MIGGKGSFGYLVTVVSFGKFLIILLGGKEGLHTLYLKGHLDLPGELVFHNRKRQTNLFLCIHGRTHGSEKVRIFCFDGMLLIQL